MVGDDSALATRLWGAKEAAYKAWCTGLDVELDHVDPRDIRVTALDSVALIVHAVGDLHRTRRPDRCAARRMASARGPCDHPRVETRTARDLIDATLSLVNDKLKVWGSHLIEPATLAQAERTARLSVVEGVRLMPDAHIGRGATVGSVVTTRNAIIPAAVGVDIGCGMAAVRTDVAAHDLPDSLDPLLRLIALAVPAGVGVAKRGHNVEGDRWMAEHGGRFSRALESSLVTKAAQQMGTLGSGNHFLEVDVDEDDRVWLVLHSGSRGIGNILGSQHIKTAAQLAKAAHIKLEDRDLAWLDEGTETFSMYVTDMLLCQDYTPRQPCGDARQRVRDVPRVAWS